VRAGDARIVVVGFCMENDRSDPMLGIMKNSTFNMCLATHPIIAYSLRRSPKAGRCGPLGNGARRHDGVANDFADLAIRMLHTKIISSRGGTVPPPPFPGFRGDYKEIRGRYR